MSPKRIDRHLFVIIGGTGDLVHGKLLPALWHINRDAQLHGRSRFLAVGRRTRFDDASFRQWARDALHDAGIEAGDDSAAMWCDECLHYQSLGHDGTDYEGLAQRIEELENSASLPGNRVFYLAIPPAALPATIEGLGKAGLHKSGGWIRLVVEKPFGRDETSAAELQEQVSRYFSEEQIYRIDHYLGKETVQNLLVFRFGNALFEAVWNRHYVTAVHITQSEERGVEGRGEFFDQTGAIRDIVQNHLMQLLALTTMEAPVALDARSIRDEKAKVLRCVMPPTAHDAVLGQYTAGAVNGMNVPGYREEKGVRPDSPTETFAAMRLYINNWRWQGVPFYLRTGKCLPKRLTEIVVNFRCPVLSVFNPYEPADVAANSLVITLQPDEGFDLHFEVKSPGPMLALSHQSLSFRYGEVFGRLRDAYEALLIDIMAGDQTLFVHIDEVMEAWRLVTPLLALQDAPHEYVPGTWGPPQAERFAAPRGATCSL